MNVATITQVKNRLSAFIDRVKAGESILILDRGVPVARLEPAVTRDSGDDDGRLARLERAGIVTRGAGEYPHELLDEPPPRAKKSVLEALLEERREGR
jgi:prevent-host-death family protein